MKAKWVNQKAKWVNQKAKWVDLSSIKAKQNRQEKRQILSRPNYSCSGLDLQTNYTITVSAINCGDQEGDTTVNFLILDGKIYFELDTYQTNAWSCICTDPPVPDVSVSNDDLNVRVEWMEQQV